MTIQKQLRKTKNMSTNVEKKKENEHKRRKRKKTANTGLEMCVCNASVPNYRDCWVDLNVVCGLSRIWVFIIVNDFKRRIHLNVRASFLPKMSWLAGRWLAAGWLLASWLAGCWLAGWLMASSMAGFCVFCCSFTLFQFCLFLTLQTLNNVPRELFYDEKENTKQPQQVHEELWSH